MRIGVILHVVAVLIVAVASCHACGCATIGTRAEETVTTPEGETYSFSYRGTSTSAPFGRVDATAHKLSYQTGGDDWNLQVGQDATGIDNTQQAAVVQAIVTALVQAMSSGLLGSAGDGIGAGGPATLLDRVELMMDRMEQMESIIGRLRERGLLGAGE
ncbi:MAG: hypothetical protein RBU21_05940 [FCB group bacterium]|jgi:hypothetical protein|nr:hypothetical protein [FCB group bacterium]